jgi:hypothetical protein
MATSSPSEDVRQAAERSTMAPPGVENRVTSRPVASLLSRLSFRNRRFAELIFECPLENGRPGSQVDGRMRSLSPALHESEPSAFDGAPSPELLSPAARTVFEPGPTTTMTSTGNLVLGGTLGWAVGLAAGAAAGYATQPDAGEGWFGAAEWWLGGWVGSSIGAATGVHLANGRNGNLLLSTGGALLSAPIALLVSGPVPGGIVVVPIAQIGTSVYLERLTSRRSRR